MNLSFLNPLFLIGLAAIALPIIAHLISRKSGAKKSFPALRFLISTQGDIATRSRIKDILLLLLRAFIIVFIVLIFAKPAVFSFSQKTDTSPLTIAVVIDNSFSMGYGNNFNHAKNKALEIIESMPDGSFVLISPLISLDEKDPILSAKISLLNKSIKELELSNNFTNNEKKLLDIFSQIQSAPNEKKIVTFITDFQKNGWNSEDFKRDWLELIDISPDSSTDNHAVSATDLYYAEDSIKVRSEISNFSDTKVTDLLTITKLDSEEISEYVSIEPETLNTSEVSFINKEISQSDTGLVTTTNDKLRVDDTRYFLSIENEDSKILIVDGDPREDSRLSETYYLARALETLSENSSTNITILDNDSVFSEDLSAYNIIYLANVGEITPKFSKELERFVNDGGTTVFFLGNRVRPASYNTLLKNLIPGELQTIVEDNFILSLNNLEIFSKDITNKISQINVEKLFQTNPLTESEVLIQSSNNSPFLLKKDYGQGSSFMFTSSSDTTWTNFSITPVFLPIIKKILDLENIERNNSRHFLVGDTINIQITDSSKQTVVIDPDGQKFQLDSGSSEFNQTNLPGIYNVKSDGEFMYEFAVNIDPKESNLEKIPTPSLQKEPETKGDLVKVFKEIWRYFLWGALALFVSEAACRGIFAKR